ncbi:hypothetical protein [Streptomyces incanus]|uniref:Uncharacterized protein n=1 Tax=Streptomyces incanus TaxID=887453 RepID=A0ABW0XML2_9ACTN
MSTGSGHGGRARIRAETRPGVKCAVSGAERFPPRTWVVFLLGTAAAGGAGQEAADDPGAGPDISHSATTWGTVE